MGVLDNYGIQPQDLTRGSIRRAAVDTCVLGYIHYIGSQDSGIVDIANTTGDITCKHGALSSETADTTFNAQGGTPGTVDLSAEATTFAALKQIFDEADNWEFIPECVLPTDATESGGTSYFINNITGGDADTATGYAVLVDTSAALYHSIGVTNFGSVDNPHGSDANVYHEITFIQATTTYGSGTSTINVYEVNDIAGTATLLFTIAGGATTVEAKHPTDGSHWPFVNTKGNRLVVKVVNSAAMTAADMTVYFGTYPFGAAVRGSKLRSSM